MYMHRLDNGKIEVKEEGKVDKNMGINQSTASCFDNTQHERRNKVNIFVQEELADDWKGLPWRMARKL